MGLIPPSGRSPEVENGNYSSALAREIPWTEEPGWLSSMGLPNVSHIWAHKHVEHLAMPSSWNCEVVNSLSCVWLFVTPWTVTHQAPPSMEFSTQEYWSGLPFPSCGKKEEKKKKWNSCLVIWFLVVPWTVANQAPLSMEFSRQEYWSG